MPNCIVLGCPHRCGKKDKFPGVIMHAFPRSLERIKAWLLRTGQMFEDLDGFAQRICDGKKNSAHRLCSAHFTIDSYILNKTNKILRPDALPSIFPLPGCYHRHKRARKQKKNKDSSTQPSNTLPDLLWQESSRREDWTKREYLFRGAETQTDLSCFGTRDLHRNKRSFSDKEFQQLLCDPPHVFEHSLPNAPLSLLAGLKEELVQFPCAKNGVIPTTPELPRLLTSIKSEDIDEHQVDQHEDAIRRIVIDFPEEDVYPGLEDKINYKGSDHSLLEAEEMPKCIVKGCMHFAGRKNSTPGVTLHMFPKDLASIKKWLLQTNQDFGDLDLFAQGILQGKMGVSRMCSAHFAPESYTLVGSQKMLLEGAIPTIFPERDKPPTRTETAATPVFQNIYLPLNLWSNNVSMVANVAPWGVNQLISPGININQDRNIVANNLGVNVRTSAAEHKPQEKPNEKGNLPTTDIAKCPHPSSESIKTHTNVPDTMLHEQPNTDIEMGPMVPHLSTKKISKAIQWPEYENNVDGEAWKVMHDHFYRVPYGNKYEEWNRFSLMTEYMPKGTFGSYFESTHSESEMFSMLQYMANVFTKYKDIKSPRILNQALEIVSLIAGEEWVIVNKNSIHRGVHQLTGEFPVKCGDVAVYFNTDEWDYIHEHKQDYKELVTDDIPMNRTWEVPNQWDFDPMIDEKYDYEQEEEEEEEIEDPPKKEDSSDWEPDSDGGSEEGYKSPEKTVEEPQVNCDQCEESFPDLEALEAHKATHLQECEDCEELFSTKAELIKHRAENHAVKRYACIICGIQYDYKSQFIIHQRAHTGEKPFECEDCGAKFGHRSSLLVHQRRHSEGKTFECSRCDRRFDKRSELVRHVKSHDAKKQYKCRTCGKTFVQKAAHERHKVSKVQCEKCVEEAAKKKYKCKKCGKRFAQKGTIERHMWFHHDDD